MLPVRLPAPAPRKRGRTIDPLGRTPETVLRSVWLTEIPTDERIIYLMLRGKCFLCHQTIYTTTEPDSHSLSELVAHLELHKQSLELVMTPQHYTLLSRYQQQVDRRVRYAPSCECVGTLRIAHLSIC